MTYSTSAKFDINSKIEDYVNCCILEAQNWVDLVHLCYNKFQLNIDPIENIPRKPLEKFSRSLDISVFEWITMFEKYIDYPRFLQKRFGLTDGPTDRPFYRDAYFKRR